MSTKQNQGDAGDAETGPGQTQLPSVGPMDPAAPVANVPIANEEDDLITRLAMACPLCVDWCSYKGEVYFAGINWERSKKAKRLMFDLSYCATQYLAGGPPIVMKTVAWHPKKFTNIGRVAR